MMKQCMIFLAFLFLSTSVLGQYIESGTWSFGSSNNNLSAFEDHLVGPHSAGYRFVTSSNRNGANRSTGSIVYFREGFSYFATDNFSIGAEILLSFDSENSRSFGPTLFQPELRYYFNSPFFLSVNPGIFTTGGIRSQYSSSSFDYILSFSAGFTVFSSEDFAFEPKFTYSKLFLSGHTGRVLSPGLLLRYFPGRTTEEEGPSTDDKSIQKGKTMLGGSLNLEFGEKENLVVFSPRLGFFLTNGWAVGTGFNYSSYYESRRMFSDPQRSNQFEWNLFTRLYPFDHLFLQLESDVLLSHSDSDNEDLDLKQRIVTVGIGYTLFISPSVALEPYIVYNSLRSENKGSTAGTSNSIQRLGALGFEISVQAFL